MTVGEKIKTARLSKGLSQRQVAEQLKISQPAYLEWEHGDSVPSWAKMVSLSNILHCSLDWLAGKEWLSDLTEGLRELKVLLSASADFARNYSGKEFYEFSNSIVSMNLVQLIKLEKVIELFDKMEN